MRAQCNQAERSWEHDRAACRTRLMIVQKFFAWADSAPPEKRAAAAAALARSFLASDMLHFDRRSAEAALTVLLDDPAKQVRAALAEVFAESCEAPRHIVLALAVEPSDVSAVVLARSPLLADEDLIDCAAIGDVVAQTAVASRARVAPGVAAAIAEVGRREALLALTHNRNAAIPDFSLRRMFERCDDAELREALIGRDDLPADLRLDIAARTAASLAEFVVFRGWMSEQRAERAARDALERTTVVVAADSSRGARELVAHLRVRGQLTLALLLRSLLSGERALLEAALTELTGQPYERVCGLVRHWAGGGFAALYDKAGLPRALLPAFRAALSAQDEVDEDTPAGPARLRRRLVERVLTACESIETSGLGPVVALFRRLACEAAREDARELSRTWRPGPPQLSTAPIEIDLKALEAELMAA
jgi:uncharacterized protein (DUF2336 family)